MIRNQLSETFAVDLSVTECGRTRGDGRERPVWEDSLARCSPRFRQLGTVADEEGHGYSRTIQTAARFLRSA